MTAHESNLSPSEEELLDRLVDDELDEAQRRTLLASFERKPEGWRRCALAFLEAQCWRRELRGMASEKPGRAAPARQLAPSPQAPLPAPPPVPRRNTQWRTTALAMAAGILVALGLSYEFRFGSFSGSSSSNSSSLTQAGLGTGRSSASNDPWRVVTLTGSDASGVPQSVRLPAQERRQLDANSWQGEAGSIPPEIAQALKDSGHEIQQSRQLMPVPLQDGRKLVVPVDQVDVHYVGNPEYQ